MYDAAFYDLIRPEAQGSANALGPLLAELFKPASVIDVGCGEGWWAKAFQDAGVETVAGVDGHDGAHAVVPYRQVDLGQPFTGDDDMARFDLAVCLEVAEHLAPERAEGFVSDLCVLAPVVAFSAAIPGQGGVGHLNEQPPQYWADLFEACGYVVTGALRWRIWDDQRVAPYYRANLLVACAPEWAMELTAAGIPFTGPAAEPLHVVHPLTFAHLANHRKGRR